MVVQHNLTAMNSNRMLGLTTATQAKSTEKLSSGYKINRAADDAAGLSISEKMRKQMRGLSQASLNAQDGISAVQTAEGALNEVQDMLQRMNELAVKASNGTMSVDDRSYIQNEIDQLVTEIDRVSETTKFNETYLLKGSKQESEAVDVSSVIGGTVQEGKAIEARGNIYTANVTSTLASGTEETATIEYLDADGNKRTKDVTFTVGANNKATAANFAEAINADAELCKVFTASSDENGKLSVESKLDGLMTDNTKNKLTAIKFATDAGAKNTKVTDTTDVAATGGAYEITLAGDNTATLALAKLADGSSITIDGKTYTFDANKAAGNTGNTFKSLQDLQDLLGDDYELSIKMTATSTNTTDAGAPDYELEQIISAKDLGATAIDNATTAGKFTNIANGKPATAANAANYTLKAGTVQATIVVAKKADVDNVSNSINFSLQVGADTSEENKISIDIQSMSARSLGIHGLRVDGKNSANADAAVDVIGEAIQKVSTQRSALGAVQNRLEHTINNLDNVVENTTAAESQIRDTDMASEMVKYSNNNILAQAGQAMLAQANQSNQGVLSLLG